MNAFNSVCYCQSWISALSICSLLLSVPFVSTSDASGLPIREENLPILPDRTLDKDASSDFNCSADEYGPSSPVVLCRYLPPEFIWCEPPARAETRSVETPTAAGDAAKPTTSESSEVIGCKRWGGRRFEDVERTRVRCHALRGIECRGNRTFHRGSVPCIHYSGHHFLTTLLYSLLLGFLGIDRFCLGHTGSAVGKLLTLGGLGVWWVVDIVLLIIGDLRPADDSNWMPYY